MDNKNNSGQENVNDTLYNWATKHPQIIKIAFGKTDDGDFSDIDENLNQILKGEPGEKDVVAKKLYQSLWGAHSQFGPLPPFELLQEFERDRVFYVDYRDHTTHSLFTCILGLYIYDKNKNIRDSFSNFIEKMKLNDLSGMYSNEELFVFLWLLSSLYHDIGYLVENNKIDDPELDGYFGKLKININKLLQTPLANTPVFSRISEPKEKKFINSNSFVTAHEELISVNDIEKSDNFEKLKQASDFSYLITDKQETINGIKQYFDFAKGNKAKYRDSGFRDHGISSALLLLYIWYPFCDYINELCSKKNFNQYYSDVPQCRQDICSLKDQLKSFSEIVNSAARAISLHNICYNIWKEDDARSKDLNLQGFRIYLKNHENCKNAMPLAFLLRLCDELQIWDRPRFRVIKSERENIHSKDIGLVVSDRGIFLRFFKDEKRFLYPEKEGLYFSLNETLKDYLNEADLDYLINYGTYHTVSDNNGFIRIFNDNTNKDCQNCNFLKNIGDLLSNGKQCANVSEKNESANDNKTRNHENNEPETDKDKFKHTVMFELTYSELSNIINKSVEKNGKKQ